MTLTPPRPGHERSHVGRLYWVSSDSALENKRSQPFSRYVPREHNRNRFECYYKSCISLYIQLTLYSARNSELSAVVLGYDFLTGSTSWKINSLVSIVLKPWQNGGQQVPKVVSEYLQHVTKACLVKPSACAISLLSHFLWNLAKSCISDTYEKPAFSMSKFSTFYTTSTQGYYLKNIPLLLSIV